MALQDDGKIACTANTNEAFDLQVVRFTTEPALDFDFGDGGGVTALDYTGDWGGHLVLRPDGTMFAIGRHDVPDGAADLSAFAVARLSADGIRDSSFGSDGQLVVSTPGENVRLHDAIAGPAEGLLVVLVDFGAMPEDGVDDALLVGQLAGDGAADLTFGDGGWLRIPVEVERALGSALISRRADGRIAVVTTLDDGAAQIFQLDATGALDPSFGDGGVTTLRLPTPQVARARYTTITEDADRRLIVAGGDYAGLSDQHLLLWRVDESGVADAAFGAGGLVDVTTQGGDVKEVVVDQSGALLTLGLRNSYGGQVDETHVVLTRFDDTGGVSGELELETVATSFLRIAILPDGKYLLMWGGNDGYGLARVVPFSD